MSKGETVLCWLLRVSGLVTLSATLAVVMPWDWMAAIHRWLGLGELPHTPIVEYLARSTSALYAIHGAVVFYSSFDVRRNRGLILLLGLIAMSLGAVLIGVDIRAGLPWRWTVGEGLFVVLLGVLILVARQMAGRGTVSGGVDA